MHNLRKVISRIVEDHIPLNRPSERQDLIDALEDAIEQRQEELDRSAALNAHMQSLLSIPGPTTTTTQSYD